MINAIIYSFNRACQLDLALRSIKDHFVEWDQCDWNIIVKYSNDEYKKGYDRVKELHPEFNMIVESNFKANTLQVYNSSNKPYVAWMMDDDAFIRKMSLSDEPFRLFKENPDISCVSPRLAPYMTECYTQSRPVKLPDFSPHLTWNWRQAGQSDLFHGYPSDWGYPMSIASFHVFRKKQLDATMNSINFKAPNSLEGHMALRPVPGNLMVCYMQARNVNIPINKVQTENGNRAGSNPILQQDSLNREFINGRRLSTEPVYHAITPSPHYELDLELE